MESAVIALSNRSKTFRKMLLQVSAKRADDSLPGILPFLKNGEKVLDLGCGVCSIMNELKQRGFQVVGADIKNLSIYKEHSPHLIKDGKLPFLENEFDVVLIHTVLHHTENPQEVIREAKRVAKKMIIVEETYTNMFQKYLTFMMDSMTNLQFVDHPHSNKTIEQWLEVFDSLGLKTIDNRTIRYWLFFDSTTFYLEKAVSKTKTSK